MNAAVLTGVITAGVVAVVVVLWALWVTLTVLLRLAVDGRGVPRLWRASFRDALSAVRVIGWSILGRRGGAPSDAPEVAAGADVVVVMLHGTAADGTCMRRWARAVKDAGIEAPVLAPDHGVILRDPAIHGERITHYLREVLVAAPGARLVLVAHSMGGVAMRHALAAADDVRDRTIGAITVASPHHGTALAARFRVGPLAILAWQSPTILALAALATLVPRVRSFASDVDVIVYPPATCDAGDFVVFEGIGHARLLTHPRVASDIAEAIRGVIVDAGRVA